MALLGGRRLMNDIDILVVANKHRPPLITEYLKGEKYSINYTKDYDLPEKWKPNYQYTRIKIINQTGAYRCFKGHQDVLKMALKDYVLVLEDDAVPNREDWKNIVIEAKQLLNRFEIVSLHGRKIQHFRVHSEIPSFTYVTLADGFLKLKWALGSLAYLMKKDSIKKFLSFEYVGLPVDLLLLNKFNCCIIDPSPFDHDRKFGSLVEKPK